MVTLSLTRLFPSQSASAATRAANAAQPRRGRIVGMPVEEPATAPTKAPSRTEPTVPDPDREPNFPFAPEEQPDVRPAPLTRPGGDDGDPDIDTCRRSKSWIV